MEQSIQDWSALIRGEHAALERLYRDHADALFRYGKQFAEADTVADEIQSLFIKLWEKHSTLNPNAVPRPYLLISLRNALLKKVKRAQRTTELDEAPAAATDSIEEQLVSAENQAVQTKNLKAAIEQLSARERELVELRFLQEMDYEQIVEITGISYQSARNTLTRAIGKLRDHLSVLLFFAFLGYKSLAEVLSLCNTLLFHA